MESRRDARERARAARLGFRASIGLRMESRRDALALAAALWLARGLQLGCGWRAAETRKQPQEAACAAEASIGLRMESRRDLTCWLTPGSPALASIGLRMESPRAPLGPAPAPARAEPSLQLGCGWRAAETGRSTQHPQRSPVCFNWA